MSSEAPEAPPSVPEQQKEQRFEDWVKGVQISSLPTGGQRMMVHPSREGVFTEYELCHGKTCQFGVSSQNIVDIPSGGLLLNGTSAIPELIRLRACALQQLKKTCTPWTEKTLAKNGVVDKTAYKVPRALEHLIFRHRELRKKLRSYGQEMVKAVRAYDEEFRRECPKDAVRFISELNVEHFISIGNQGMGEGLVQFSEARVLAETEWVQSQTQAEDLKKNVAQQKRQSILFGVMSISSGISAAASATSSIPGILPTVNTLAGSALVLFAAKDASTELEKGKVVNCHANTKIRALLDSVHTRLNITNEQLQVVVIQLQDLISKMDLKDLEELAKLYPEVPQGF